MKPEFKFSGNVTKDWAELRNIWKQSEHVLSGEVGALWETPIQHQVCLDFAKNFPDSRAFLIDQLSDQDPRVAAYAFKILIRLNVRMDEIPNSVIERKEEIGVHIHSRIRKQTLGNFVADFFQRYSKEPIAETDRRTQEWQEGPLANYKRAKEAEQGEQ